MLEKEGEHVTGKKYSTNVGREMVEKAGVDVDLLIDKLKKLPPPNSQHTITILCLGCTALG